MLTYKAERTSNDIALALDGVDHVEIETQLPWILEVLNGAEELKGIQFIHTDLEHYLNELRKRETNWPVLKGEQRETGFSGANNWPCVHFI